jgi:hypothetical protein
MGSDAKLSQWRPLQAIFVFGGQMYLLMEVLKHKPWTLM